MLYIPKIEQTITKNNNNNNVRTRESKTLHYLVRDKKPKYA